MNLSEEQLAELIAAVAPAPAAWVQAAKELPAGLGAIDAIVARAQSAASAREAVLADLEGALREAGVTPRRGLVDSLDQRLRA